MDEPSLIPTKASVLKGIKKVEEVSFVSYKPKGAKFNGVQNSVEPSYENPSFVMKKAKNEVIKLGMSKLEGQEKRNAKIQLLVKLGAKPPKRKPINYKRLLEKNKASKNSEESNTQLQQIGKNSLGKSIAKNKFDKKIKKDKKQNNKDLLSIYGKVNITK